ncbi:hypothetical protein PspLS_07738 [Pyricularia sp. CBS 133598]|nr:hypothetical protein PspLS_07738 [Pyricularia sp. CBS 133598]
MRILAPTGMFLKLVWAWCLLLASSLLCVADARDNPEARNGPAVSEFPSHQKQLRRNGQGQQTHPITLGKSHSEALVVEPRAYPADPAPPRPYGFDYIDPLTLVSTTVDGTGFTTASHPNTTGDVSSVSTPSLASSIQALSLTPSSTETTSQIKFTSAALPVAGSRLVPLVSTGSAASSSISNGSDTLSALPIATPTYPIVSDATPLSPRSSLVTIIFDSTESIGSSIASALNVIETSVALSDGSKEASQAQNSASIVTDATRSNLMSEQSGSISTPLSGFTTSTALPVGSTRQARTASSTSTITPHTSAGCGTDGRCLGSVSVATPALDDAPSTTSGNGGAWTSTISFWTSSWQKCFKDATGTELRSCPATTANDLSSSMYIWCHQRVLRGDHTVNHMHRWPNDGTLPCLIIADTVYLNRLTNYDRGYNSCILNFANLYRWPIGAMQSSPTAYKELSLFIVTTTLYRRPDDRALSGPTTRQKQQQ